MTPSVTSQTKSTADQVEDTSRTPEHSNAEVLRLLGLAPGKNLEKVTEIVQDAAAKLKGQNNAIAWFKKFNHLLGASPVEMIRLGRVQQLASYVDSMK